MSMTQGAKAVGPPSTEDVVRDLREAAEVGAGTEYAAAVGWIRAITTASRYGRYGRYAGLSDAERLAEIVRVLDAIDQIVDERHEAEAADLGVSGTKK